MGILQRFFEPLKLSAQYIFIGADRSRYPDTFIEELEYQCRRIVPLAAFACFFIPLGYLSVDQLNFPDKLILPWLRVGLSIVSVIATIVAFFRLVKYWGFASILLIAFYLVLQAALATLISNVEPAYMAGFILCLVIPALILPVPLLWLNILFIIIYGIFFIGLWVINFNQHTIMQLYSFQDLTSAIFITFVFGFLQAKTRESIYQRSKNLEAERLEADRLLLNILPESVAYELKNQGQLKPSLFENVTICFTHFVGFTQSLESQPVEDVINKLDQCFGYFDSVVQNYSLEKLKTMGDKYMFVGGLPNSNKTHAIDCCLAAVSMLNYVKKVTQTQEKQGKEFWKLSVGIASGPAVSGIVGKKKFVYDVWGQTVNIASRLEGESLENKIHISLSTKQLITEIFECQPYQIQDKIQDQIQHDKFESFIIERLKPEYSYDKEGQIPNERLLEFRASLLGN
ncbi:MAG: adenylate/guanylate cyclase domain-containing protein [Leptonema sp. (in: Bacteria)]|nr:adenylate/guanylate cyclase domain-containing protein [Leptonema sp. (in: bacteria)]